MGKIMLLFLSMYLMTFSLNAQRQIVVAQDGSGQYTSIQDAINSIPYSNNEEIVVSIRKGTYKEKIFVDRNYITLKGEDQANTIITISLARDFWRCSAADDYGTATINLKGSDIKLENLTFINSYGKDNPATQSYQCKDSSGQMKVVSIKPNAHQMALRSFNTTRLIVFNCTFIAYGGDTVSPWNTDYGMFYFRGCTMEGGVDFYCPRGWALAEDCRFICHSAEAAIWHDGSIHESSKTVLRNCSFTGDDGFKLGRFHRDAQFYLISCNFPRNMADADIYLRESNPPNVIKWGKRVYYFNCHRDGGDYSWHKDNLPASLSVNDITMNWIYDGKWDPEKSGSPVKDPVAENMLLYQRANGGWPKHFQGNNKVDYNKQLTEAELRELKAGYEKGIDATIDNEATTKEIRYLVKQYKATANLRYLRAAEQGVLYLLTAQYANGGWPQYYPDFSLYRGEITYNDNAMVNVLNVLMDVAQKKNDMDVIDTLYTRRCELAVQRGIDCILKTQIKQNGVLTAWCAQYDANTMKPAKARMFELPSLSGMESVGIVRFLMRVDNPGKDIIASVNGAIGWFDKVKIVGFKMVDIAAPNEPGGKDRVIVADPSSTIWARFYDLDTNEPFFSGRDSQRKKTLAEVENERRIGYAWYGTWPAKLIDREYPQWKTKWNIK